MITPNPKLRSQLQTAAVQALSEINLRIEAAAKAELYPGHGKRTGAMQRAITGEPAVADGTRVRGRVVVKGIPYGVAMEKRYRYMRNGFNKVRADGPRILAKHVAKVVK